MYKLLDKLSYLKYKYHGQSNGLFIPLLILMTFGINLYYRHKYFTERKELIREPNGTSDFFISTGPVQRFFLSFITAIFIIAISWFFIRLFPKLLKWIIIPTSIYEIIYYIIVIIHFVIHLYHVIYNLIITGLPGLVTIAGMIIIIAICTDDGGGGPRYFGNGWWHE